MFMQCNVTRRGVLSLGLGTGKSTRLCHS